METLANLAIGLVVVVAVIVRRMNWASLEQREVWGTPVVLMVVGGYQLRGFGDQARSPLTIGVNLAAMGLVVSTRLGTSWQRPKASMSHSEGSTE